MARSSNSTLSKDLVRKYRLAGGKISSDQWDDRRFFQENSQDLPLYLEEVWKSYRAHYEGPLVIHTKTSHAERDTWMISFPGLRFEVHLVWNSQPDEGFQLQWTHGGQLHKVHLNPEHILRPEVWSQQILPIKPLPPVEPWMELRFSDWQSFSDRHKKTFADQIAGLLVDLEKIGRKPGQSSRSKTVKFWPGAWLSELWAIDGFGTLPCLRAGHIGQFLAGTPGAPCEIDSQYLSDGQILCNPLLFSGTVRVPSNSANATEECNRRSPIQNHFRDARSEDDFLRVQNQVRRSLQEVYNQVCNASRRAVATQFQVECNAIQRRLDTLNALTCDQVREIASRLQCSPPTSSQQSPTLAPAPTSLPQCQDERAARNRSDLQCGRGSIETLRCQHNGGEQQHFYCICPPGTRPEYANTIYPTRCVEDSQNRSTGEEGNRSSSRRRSSQGFWRPWMGVALAGVIGIAAWYYFTKQALKDRQRLFTPQPPTPPPPVTPPPAVPTPIPPGTPVPVDSPRNPPGGTR